jgi:hypothetical protein
MEMKLHPQSLHKFLSPLEKENLPCPLGWRLDGTQKWPECGGEQKISFQCCKYRTALLLPEYIYIYIFKSLKFRD